MNLKKLQKSIPFFVFALFIILQACTHIYLVQFGDDYYYTTFFNNGLKHFVEENIFHYLQTNGRAWVHILDEILLVKGSIFAWKIFNVAVISFTVWLIAKLAAGDNNERFGISLVISCFLFSSLNILNLRQSVYWATGSLNYLFPILLLLLLFFKLQNANSNKLSPLIVVLAFFACSSTEQAAFGSLICVCLAVYTSVLKLKRLTLSYCLCFIAALVGFVFLFAAPGNAVRKTYYPDFYSMSFVQRVVYNIPKIISLVFSDYGFSSIIVLYLSSSALNAFSCVKETIGKVVFFFSLTGASALLLNNYLSSNVLVYISFFCAVAVILQNFIISLIEFKKSKDLTVPFFTLMPVILQGAMLISPEFGARTTLISAVMLMIPTVKMFLTPKRSAALFAFALTALLISRPSVVIIVIVAVVLVTAVCFAFIKRRNAVVYCAAFVCVILMVFSQTAKIAGYRKNYIIHEYNSENVRQYLDNSDFTQPLEQYYLANDIYKYTMPYDDPYHAMWYKISRGIPQETEIKYSNVE